MNMYCDHKSLAVKMGEYNVVYVIMYGIYFYSFILYITKMREDAFVPSTSLLDI